MSKTLHCCSWGGGGLAEPDTDLPESLRELGPCLEIAGKLNTGKSLREVYCIERIIMNSKNYRGRVVRGDNLKT